MNQLHNAKYSNLFLFLLLIILGSCSICLAANDSTITVDSTYDGPHVFWQNDSSAIVFYLCGGVVDSQSFSNIDTIRFTGFCNDEHIEYIIPADKPQIEPYQFKDVSKVFAVSDVHGEYEYLVNILKNSGVIDDNLHWIWSEGHLVINGDVFDRGDKVTECLWLIYNLEMEARQYGGYVHFVLGNHEIMPIRNDIRYVHDRYKNGIVRKTRISYQDMFGPDMELGQWLRSKHTAIIINDILFVHAGIAPEIMEMGMKLNDLNDSVRVNLDLSSAQLSFSKLPKFLYGGVGPVWYRGYFEESENRYIKASDSYIDSTLSYFDVSTIVVGHTGVDVVVGMYDNRIIAIDIPFEDLHSLQALLYQDNKFFRVTGSGELQLIK
jgi:Calcineurin-like phosphoesterase